MKENFRREYLRRTKLIMKSRLHGRNKIIAINNGLFLWWVRVRVRLNSRNKIIAINAWAVSLVRYDAHEK